MATHAAKQDLEGLPPETLQQIAGYLHETPSLSAFSLASKTCHSAALPSLFRNIHLAVHDRKALQRDVDTLIEILSRSESASHVRRLSITGSLGLDVEGGTAKLSTDELDTVKWFKETGAYEIFDGQEPVFKDNGVHVCTEPVIERSSEEDMAWAPVVGLIKTLPGLTTLEYDCRNQFPPLLLDAIEEHKCKLHHMTFRLRSLLSDTLDPYEMALATSPCLYKAQVRCAWRDSNGDDDFNEEAMMELAAGLAPNLKELVVVGLQPPIPFVKRHRPRGPWRGLPGFVPGKHTGSLTALTFLASVYLSVDTVQSWARHIDFSCLRHLGLGGGYTSSGLTQRGIDEEVMDWMIQNCSFHRLRSLRVHLSRDLIVERPGFADTASTFFKLFKPLYELSVSGSLEPKILDAILSRHGPTLQKLSLRPIDREMIVPNGRALLDMPMVFEREHILQIQTQCPALRELAITVKRTKSDATEAKIYKIFGKMGCLQSLFLTLDCSDRRIAQDSTRTNDPSFDEFDREMYLELGLLKGHVRDTFMNCAVDETLARSIWETICGDKKGRPLQSLKLWTTGGGRWLSFICHGGILDAAKYLSRSWLIERRNDNNMIDVRELGRWGRKGREQIMAVMLYKRKGRRDLQQVFRRIWPHKEGSKDWRDDWASLPLQS